MLGILFYLFGEFFGRAPSFLCNGGVNIFYAFRALVAFDKKSVTGNGSCTFAVEVFAKRQVHSFARQRGGKLWLTTETVYYPRLCGPVFFV